jgi:signal peptidase II
MHKIKKAFAWCFGIEWQPRLLNTIWWLFSLLLLGLDRYSKLLAIEYLTISETLRINNFFNLDLVYNRGVAFGLLHHSGGLIQYLLNGLISCLIIGLAIVLLNMPTKQKSQSFALMLVLGGALGNFYDRIILGQVVDFLQLHYNNLYWPTFNLADCFVCIGLGWLIITLFKAKD